MPAHPATPFQMPAKSEPGHLRRPRGVIAWDFVGHGSRLLLALPGMGDHRGQFRHLTPPLLEAGYRVVTVDPRGQGDSTGSWDDYSVEAVAGDVLALIREQDWQNIHLFGHSAAAGAAVIVAAEAPERTASLTLAGPFVRDIPMSLGQRLAVRLGFAGPWAPRAWGTYYRSLYPHQPPADLQQHIESLVATLRKPGRLEALRQQMRASKAAAENRLTDVRCPTLVLMGSADPDYADPEAEAQHVAERLAGQHVMLEGMGHYPHVEAAEHVARILEHFHGRS